MRKRKLELTEYMLFFALMLYTFMFCNSLNAQTLGNPNNDDIYGEWASMDGQQMLYLNYTDKGDTFNRISPDGEITGKFKVEDKYFLVKKKGVKEYKLMFYIKGIRLIVVKPETDTTEGMVWLFQKVSNIQKEY